VRLGFAPSRRAAGELIADGRVRVNGRRIRKGEAIASGDRVEVADVPAAVALAPDTDLKIAILFADAAVIVAAKPPLVPCHPLRPGERATVMNAIVAAYPETAQAGDRPLEGGLVHRLDNGTSGALMVARNRVAFTTMREALRAGHITRHYRALVTGRLDGTIEITSAIAHHQKNPRKMVVVDTVDTVDAFHAGGGAGSFDDARAAPIASVSNRYRSSPRPALTRVEPLSYIGGFTLVQVTPRTGNRHQIRVHLASIGNPLAGDSLYGGPPLDGLEHGRFWLHLAELEFDSPAGGRAHVTAPLASDLEASLKFLRPPVDRDR
jgi:23S rRNA pseudouridine1911/1915/1917 synthase